MTGAMTASLFKLRYRIVARTTCYWCLLLLGSIAGTTLQADELGATSVFPCGVRSGTKSVVRVDSARRWPVAVESTEPRIVWKAEQEKLTFTVDVPRDLPPQLVWFRLYDAKGISRWLPLLIGSTSRAADTEPNDRIEQATSVSLPCTIDGRLDKSGDVDVYRLHLDKDKTFVARVTANFLLESPIDAVLQVCDAAGHVLLQNHDDRGLDPTIAFTPREEGDYLLRIFAFPSKPNSGITFTGSARSCYQIEVSSGPPLAVAAPISITVDARVPATRTWQWSGAPDSHGLSPVYFVDPAAHIVELASRRRDAPRPSSPLSLPLVVNGQFAESREVHEFSIEAKANEEFALEVWSNRIGYRVDPYLEIIDEAGKRIAKFDDISRGEIDISTKWKAAAAGTYRLVLRDRFGDCGDRWRYLLSVERLEPSVELSVDTFHWQINDGKPVTIEVAVSRHAGWEEEFTLAIEGLPSNIECQPVTVTGKEAIAKLTLTLVVRETQPASGFAVQIVARRRDGT